MRDLIRNEAVGSFALKFSDEASYNNFVELLEQNITGANLVPMTLHINNTKKDKTTNFYCSFEAVIYKDLEQGKIYRGFNFSVEEK